MAEKPTRIETEIIKYLALNPKDNTQRIQRGIGLKDKNYPTVRKAIRRLQKKYIVQYSTGKSKKKVTIKIYRLTPRGVFVALGICSDNDLVKILEKNKYESDDLFLLKEYVSRLSEPTAKKILRSAGKFALSNLELTASKTIVSAIIMHGLTVENFSEEEQKEISKAAMKIKKIKGPIKEMFKYVKEVFDESEKLFNEKSS